MSKENPLWGAERIRGELLKLGIAVSNRSIRRYRWHGSRPEGNHQRWRAFLRPHQSLKYRTPAEVRDEALGSTQSAA